MAVESIMGTFLLRLRGLPFLFVARLNLTSTKGNRAQGRALFIGPFTIGFLVPKRFR